MRLQKRFEFGLPGIHVLAGTGGAERDPYRCATHGIFTKARVKCGSRVLRERGVEADSDRKRRRSVAPDQRKRLKRRIERVLERDPGRLDWRADRLPGCSCARNTKLDERCDDGGADRANDHRG